MDIQIFETAAEAAHKLSEILVLSIQKRPNLVLGLATGRTMDSVYHKFVSLAREAQLSCKDIKTFALDEYIGLSKNNIYSYEYYLNFRLYEQLDFNSKNTSIPNVFAEDLDLASYEYDQKIRSLGGIDLQILGIGLNGHIGLNEPGSAIDSRTRVVGLSSSTLKSNSSLHKKEVPNTAITMGIGTILEAKEIILLATGETKSEIIQKLVNGDVHSQNPSSAIKTHSNVKLILDKDAAKLI